MKNKFRYEVTAHTPGKNVYHYSSTIDVVYDWYYGDLQKYEYLCIFDTYLNEWILYNAKRGDFKDVFVTW